MTLSSFTLFLGCLWGLSTLLETLEFVSLWQLKEYRLDRFRDLLRTKEGARVWRRPQTVWRLFALILVLLPLSLLPPVRTVLLCVALLDLAFLGFRLISHALPRPKVTTKAALVFAVSVCIEIVVAFVTRSYALVITMALLRVVVVGFAVFAVNIPTGIAKRVMIELAKKKLASYGELFVIGITGSYGKSSTKEFLDTILSVKYAVVRTPKNINTEIGVAQFILRTSFDQKDVFVVEMDAYRVGENAVMCDMIRPKMGILTAINEQHLSLTGSIENTQKANYELLRSLPPDGLAIINIDNALCREPIPTIACRVETFGAEEPRLPSCLIRASEPADRGTVFVFSLGTERVSGLSPVVGTHHAYNIAPALLAARSLGISSEKMTGIFPKLHLPVHGMRIYSYGRATIIDDSYNSNPDGFAAALDVLSRFGGDRRRIVVTRGMLELGQKSDELHRRIGEEIAFLADELVLCKSDFAEPLLAGIGQKYQTTIRELFEPAELLAYMRTLKDTDVVILLENRMPENVVREFAASRGDA